MVLICGDHHYKNSQYLRKEVRTAINKLKSLHPSALITVDDLPAIFEISDTPEDQVDDNENAHL